MTRRTFVLAVVAALAFATTPGSAAALEKAPPEPDYFVDESTLPFEAVAGHEDSDRRWGIHNGATSSSFPFPVTPRATSSNG